MRITSNMMAAQQMAGLQSNMAALQKAQEQVTLGKRLTAASDDPAAAMGVMKSGSSLRALEQYRTNVKRASSRVDVEDSVLQQLGDLVTRVKQLGISQSGDTATAQTRAAANTEVTQIFQQIVQLGNTKFGSEYLFGGEQSTTPPFAATGSGATLDFTSTNPTGQRSIAIADGQTAAPTHDGKQVFLDTGVLDAVRDMSRALGPNAGAVPSILSTALTKLDTAFSSVQTVVGDTGAMANRLSSVGENLTALNTNLTTFKSNLEDIDIETAMTELTNRQLAYQAALLATSKVTGGPSLVDYLK